MKPASTVITIEDRIRKMREGYKQDLQLVIGGIEIPCRLMSASEEITIIAKAKTNIKLPPKYTGSTDSFTGIEIQKAILEAACTVDLVPYAPREFLDKLLLVEIESLYDQYVSTIRQVNPRFESMSVAEVTEMIVEVKKKEKVPSDFFTWQLAEIGKFFLDNVLQKDSEAGS